MSARPDRTPLPRSPFDRPAPPAAPDPLELRITEVEAYEGESDPGSRACRGRTARNASTSGPSRHAYVHFVSGTSRQSA
ncbi:DNA-3-methyladenine glycosylase [Streptomyces sp. NBC_01439]|uniref:DNA-3-methyladenine glycosylase n=1 Tax=Streptomyces sp. NBC_01439 TaxID=2903867 RepID=UPI002E2D8AB2|nr:DNA-3-methyladenine glycosylase [Streptomyces sp. NBC_01439]